MTKIKIVRKIAEKFNLKQKIVFNVIEEMFNNISNELKLYNKIEFRNFGTFCIKLHKSKKGRNPNKPEIEINIPDRLVIKFKPGKKLKYKVLMDKKELV